jgi:hypothetical protein
MNLYFALARQAMSAGLRILGARSGDRIAIPAFICADVPATLTLDGYEVVYYDLTESLQPDVTRNAPHADFLLLVNFFGFPVDIRSVESNWGFSPNRIVEDNAHGLFSCDQDGRALGRRTVIGFTSFRKTLRVADGGILHINNQVFVERAATERLEPLTRHLSFAQRARQTGDWVSGWSHLPLMNLLRFTKRLVIPRNSQSFDDSTRYASPASAASMEALNACNPDTERQRRREFYQSLLPQIVAAGGKPLFADLAIGISPYALPFFSSPHVAKRVQRHLWLRDFEVFPWPNLPVREGVLPDWYQNVYLVNFLR